MIAVTVNEVKRSTDTLGGMNIGAVRAAPMGEMMDTDFRVVPRVGIGDLPYQVKNRLYLVYRMLGSDESHTGFVFLTGPRRVSKEVRIALQRLYNVLGRNPREPEVIQFANRTSNSYDRVEFIEYPGLGAVLIKLNSWTSAIKFVEILAYVHRDTINEVRRGGKVLGSMSVGSGKVWNDYRMAVEADKSWAVADTLAQLSHRKNLPSYAARTIAKWMGRKPSKVIYRYDTAIRWSQRRYGTRPLLGLPPITDGTDHREVIGTGDGRKLIVTGTVNGMGTRADVVVTGPDEATVAGLSGIRMYCILGPEPMGNGVRGYDDPDVVPDPLTEVVRGSLDRLDVGRSRLTAGYRALAAADDAWTDARDASEYTVRWWTGVVPDWATPLADLMGVRPVDLAVIRYTEANPITRSTMTSLKGRNGVTCDVGDPDTSCSILVGGGGAPATVLLRYNRPLPAGGGGAGHTQSVILYAAIRGSR